MLPFIRGYSSHRSLFLRKYLSQLVTCSWSSQVTVCSVCYLGGCHGFDFIFCGVCTRAFSLPHGWHACDIGPISYLLEPQANYSRSMFARFEGAADWTGVSRFTKYPDNASPENQITPHFPFSNSSKASSSKMRNSVSYRGPLTFVLPHGDLRWAAALSSYSLCSPRVKEAQSFPFVCVYQHYTRTERKSPTSSIQTWSLREHQCWISLILASIPLDNDNFFYFCIYKPRTPQGLCLHLVKKCQHAKTLICVCSCRRTWFPHHQRF